MSNLQRTSNIEHQVSSIEHREKLLKVLFVIWSLEKGGAERFLVSLLKNIDRSKIEPTVCCLNWKGIWANELEEKGIQVIALNKKGKFDFSAFMALAKIIKKGKFDIVNTHLWGADTTGRLAAFFAGTPVVVSTTQNVDQWKRFYHKAADKLLSYKTKKIIAVSGAVKDYYHQKEGIPLAKISVIPNAIELEKFADVGDSAYLYDELRLAAKDFILACVGRLTEQKGQRYLLEAVSYLHTEYPNLRVLFVGEGEDHNQLIDLAKGKGVFEIVRFLGYRQDIPQILHLANALVLPSLYEGLPVCVLEAMACAKPVIATNVGGTAETVFDGKTGFLVEAKNSQALACGIRKLINLPDRGKEMGQKARELANGFSIKSVAQKTSELLLSLANKV